MDSWPIKDTVGEWVEYDFDDLVSVITEKAENINFEVFEKLATDAKDCFEEAQARLLSILSTIIEERSEDKYIQDLMDQIRKQKIYTASNFAQQLTPSGQQMSRDMNALQAGIHIPPHISIIAKASSLLSSFNSCEKLSKFARRAASHIENLGKKQKREERVGVNILLGMGAQKYGKI